MVTRWLSPLDIMFSLVVDDNDRLRRVVERHMVVKAAAVVLLRNMRVGGNIIYLVEVARIVQIHEVKNLPESEDFAT